MRNTKGNFKRLQKQLAEKRGNETRRHNGF